MGKLRQIIEKNQSCRV